MNTLNGAFGRKPYAFWLVSTHMTSFTGSTFSTGDVVADHSKRHMPNAHRSGSFAHAPSCGIPETRKSPPKLAYQFSPHSL